MPETAPNVHKVSVLNAQDKSCENFFAAESLEPFTEIRQLFDFNKMDFVVNKITDKHLSWIWDF